MQVHEYGSFVVYYHKRGECGICKHSNVQVSDYQMWEVFRIEICVYLDFFVYGLFYRGFSMVFRGLESLD